MMQPEFLISDLPQDENSLYQIMIPVESLSGRQSSQTWDVLSDIDDQTEIESIHEFEIAHAEPVTSQDDQISQLTNEDVTPSDIPVIATIKPTTTKHSKSKRTADFKA